MSMSNVSGSSATRRHSCSGTAFPLFTKTNGGLGTFGTPGTGTSKSRGTALMWRQFSSGRSTHQKRPLVAAKSMGTVGNRQQQNKCQKI